MDPENIGRSEIVAALARNDHKVGEAARDLGIDRRTLMRRMRVLGMPKGRPGRRYQPLHRKHRYLAPALGATAALALGVAAVSRFGKSST